MTSATSARVEIPFQGLRYFDEEQVDLFFGRDDQIHEALEKLSQSRFVTVIGSSGTGKSSLVRAGLFPALRAGLLRGVSPHWRITKSMPGEMPIRALATSIEKVFGARGVELTLRRGPLGLVEAAAQCGLTKDENLLIFIDQFEEIFRYERVSRNRAAAREEAVAFVKLLLEAADAEESKVYVVLTMRSDYLGNASNFRDLPERINRGLYLIPRMTRDQIEEAIRGPIALAGAQISAPLAQRLLNDLGDSTDQLPVLQHAMLRTWLQWKAGNRPDEPLDLRHYLQVGGLQHGLSNHANEIYDALPAAQKAVCEVLFRCLTERDAGDRDVRRPTEVGVVARVAGVHPDRVCEVAEQFRAKGTTFLMPPPEVPLEDSTKLDITHESLIRNWDKLCGTAEQKGWVQDEAELREQFAELLKRAGRKSTEDDLLRGGDLNDAIQWRDRRLTAGWAERYGADSDTFARVVSYIGESERKREQEREAARLESERVKREKEKRRVHRIAWAVGSVIGILVIFVFVAYNRLGRARAEAQAAHTQAEMERNQADAASKAAVLKRERELADLKTQEAVEDRKREADLRLEALKQRDEAVRQRDFADVLTRVSIAREWLAQPDPDKIGKAVDTLTALVENRKIPAEARLGAAVELGRAPIAALPSPYVAKLADALHNSAENDPDPKVKAAALESITAQNNRFLGNWTVADPEDKTVSKVFIDHTSDGIRVRATHPCPSGECEAGVRIFPYSNTSLVQSYDLNTGALDLVVRAGSSPTELVVRTRPHVSDHDPLNQWTTHKLNVVTSGAIRLNLFDGARQILTSVKALVRVMDGNGKFVVNDYYSASNLLFKGLPLANNLSDNHTVVASAERYGQAGFTPVKLSGGIVQSVNLMLLGKNATFNFRSAQWPLLRQSHPVLIQLLSRGAPDEAAAQGRYRDLMERSPATLAMFFNLTAAMAQVPLSQGTPLDYLKELVWDATFTESGFSAYASTKLIDEILAAARRGEFTNLGRFLPGVTSSFKHIRSGEVNLELAVYGKDLRTVDGVQCVKVYADMTYFKDLAAHVLTDPPVPANGTPTAKQVYQLRWMAGSGGTAEFKPPYTIE